MLKASPPVLDEEVERIGSLVSLKAKRGVDRCFGQEGWQYVRDGHDTPDHFGWQITGLGCFPSFV